MHCKKKHAAYFVEVKGFPESLVTLERAIAVLRKGSYDLHRKNERAVNLAEDKDYLESIDDLDRGQNGKYDCGLPR